MGRVVDYVSLLPDLLKRADDEIARAWRERDWPNFFKLLIVDSISLALFGFLMPLILGSVGWVIIRIFHAVRPRMAEAALSAYMSGMMSGLWNYAVVFGLITGFLALISAIPIVSMKGGRRA